MNRTEHARPQVRYFRVFLNQFEIIQRIELIVEHAFLVDNTILFHFPRTTPFSVVFRMPSVHLP